MIPIKNLFKLTKRAGLGDGEYIDIEEKPVTGKESGVIIEVAGQKIDADHSLSSIIRNYPVGSGVSVKIERNKEIIILGVTLEEKK